VSVQEGTWCNGTQVQYACSSNPGVAAQGANPWDTALVTQWNSVVGCVLNLLYQPQSLIDDVDIVIWGESAGEPNLVNTSDSNYQEGHPSEGLVQVIQSTFDAYRDPYLSNSIFDPAANIYAGMNSALANYGSIANIPGVLSVLSGGHYGGYDAYTCGGGTPGRTLV
jgi:transglycosylase-like protein with SLT domain